jgi:hypothetical protein
LETDLQENWARSVATSMLTSACPWLLFFLPTDVKLLVTTKPYSNKASMPVATVKK